MSPRPRRRILGGVQSPAEVDAAHRERMIARTVGRPGPQARSTPIAKCKGCRVRIFWVKTRAGKLMPLEAQAVTEATPGRALWTIEGERMVATESAAITGYPNHFATCPTATRFRRTGPAEGPP